MSTKQKSNYTNDKQKYKQQYFSDSDVATLLGISLKSLRNKLHLERPLPPYIKLPFSRKRLWPVLKVHEWLHRYLVTNQSSNTSQIKSIKKSVK